MESQTSPQQTRLESGLVTGPSPDSTLWRRVAAPRLSVKDRVRAEGKFLYAGARKFDIQGVTYGPFRPDASGCEYHDRATVERDFAAMAEAGFNAVRVYTVPPRWLLDVAVAHGLRVLVGLPWEQHVTFLDDRKITQRIVESVRAGVRECAGHPAILAYAVGNEIPAGIVRWLGPGRVERFIERLYRAAKAEDPEALVTYVSYPTTEYLQLSFLDFITFNVYLENQQKTADYVARLQNLSGELPLVMAEVGLDSLRNGEAKQAETLAWQVRTTFQGGCAGTFVFSWTDEWFRGGHEIDDWAFGLVTREREAKPALTAVREALTDPLLPPGCHWPEISVVVCSYNGEATIRETFEGLRRLDYANYEVIVVNDGSTDRTAEIAREYPEFRLIEVPNGGLSAARNLGMTAARGEIVAYIDDDAWPDPHWLSFLAVAFLTRDHVGIGGPNLAPPDDGHVADCVANSPGGPSHVLFTDLLAEHLPGCNMAFRRDAILAIEGFDTRFRIAGDDVDLCWRLMEQGGTLGFHAGAVVWHHRRGRVRDYLRQQRNYGRAEAMLEQKWPEKYNRFGHLRWAGKLYGKGHTRPLAARSRIDHGVWGTRLFQSMYTGDFDSAWYVTLMPEWYLLTAGLTGLTLLGLSWAPLFWLWPLLAFALIVPLVQVVISAKHAKFTSTATGLEAARLYSLTAALHVLQPMVRLIGRLGYRLTPWRLHGVRGAMGFRTEESRHWSETWRSPIAWLSDLERSLQSRRVLVRRGGDRDRWDLQAACGMFGGVRLISTIEEHGAGKQLIRVRAWPRISLAAAAFVPLFAILTTLAGLDHAYTAGVVLGGISFLGLYRCLRECGNALHTVRLVVTDWLPPQSDD